LIKNKSDNWHFLIITNHVAISDKKGKKRVKSLERAITISEAAGSKALAYDSSLGTYRQGLLSKLRI
jgi:hypothetical protein